MTTDKIENLNNLLPQTQCGLCGHGACLPYAKAMAEKRDSIDRCPPGGLSTLIALAKATLQDPSPYLAKVQASAKPKQVVSINEDICIGCTKCIQACPVDAIVGSSKQMHTVIEAECTGCELCIAPCPVDCIEIKPRTLVSQTHEKTLPPLRKARFLQRESRIKRKERAKEILIDQGLQENQHNRKEFIAAALARIKNKSINQ